MLFLENDSEVLLCHIIGKENAETNYLLYFKIFHFLYWVPAKIENELSISVFDLNYAYVPN